jgi:nucleotide-binding universal stress UspA family protein
MFNLNYNTMKKILIPIDFSESAQAGYHAAARIAKENHASITFLYCLDEHMDDFLFGYYSSMPIMSHRQTSIQDREARGEQILDKAINHPAFQFTRKFKHIVKSDFLSFNKEVAIYAEENQIDLILLGNPNEKITSFDAYEITEETNIPVMTVPEIETKESYPKNILAYLDFENIDSAYFNELKRWGRSMNARIKFLHVNNTKNFASTWDINESWRKLKLQYGLEACRFRSINGYEVTEAIMNYAEAGNYDLIALLKEDKTGFLSLFSSPLRKDILSKSETPVLVLAPRIELIEAESTAKELVMTRGFTG